MRGPTASDSFGAAFRGCGLYPAKGVVRRGLIGHCVLGCGSSLGWRPRYSHMSLQASMTPTTAALTDSTTPVRVTRPSSSSRRTEGSEVERMPCTCEWSGEWPSQAIVGFQEQHLDACSAMNRAHACSTVSSPATRQARRVVVRNARRGGTRLDDRRVAEHHAVGAVASNLGIWVVDARSKGLQLAEV